MLLDANTGLTFDAARTKVPDTGVNFFFSRITISLL